MRASSVFFYCNRSHGKVIVKNNPPTLQMTRFMGNQQNAECKIAIIEVLKGFYKSAYDNDHVM